MPLSASERRTLESIAEALLPPDASEWAATAPNRASGYLRFLSPREYGQFRLALRLLEHPLVGELCLRRSPRTHRLRSFSKLEVAARRRILAQLLRSPLPFARAAVDGFKRLVAVAYYADSTPAGSNPTWRSLGYPGPIASTDTAPPTLPTYRVEPDTTLSCDAVVIGSGPGGAAAASELAGRGWDVVV